MFNVNLSSRQSVATRDLKNNSEHVMLNEVKHLAKSPAESTERSFTCFEISPPYSRRNDKNMISFSTHFQIRRYIQTCC